ncbi:hypothetical protein scyTo_0017986, partial [Scyliorhinus torazame]|nr:hypothetical protein [Scyliorhinus torazame]
HESERVAERVISLVTGKLLKNMRIFISFLPLIVHAIEHSFVAPPGLSGTRLHPFIKQYEGLSYDRDTVLHQHHHAKRSLHEKEPSIHLEFTTRQRYFPVSLLQIFLKG